MGAHRSFVVGIHCSLLVGLPKLGSRRRHRDDDRPVLVRNGFHGCDRPVSGRRNRRPWPSRGKVARTFSGDAGSPCARCAAKARDKRDMEALLAAAREGRGLQMAVDMKAADGRGRLLIATVEPRRGGAAVIRFVDASYLRAAAETERAGRKWFSDYLEAMPVGVFAVDGGGHVVYANARVRALFGLEPRDVETGGRCFSEFVDPAPGVAAMAGTG